MTVPSSWRVRKFGGVLLVLGLSACATEMESIFHTYGYVARPDAVRKEFFRYLATNYPNGPQLADREMRSFLRRNRFVCGRSPEPSSDDLCRAPGRLVHSGAMSLLPPYQVNRYEDVQFTVRIRRIADGWWQFKDVQIE